MFRETLICDSPYRKPGWQKRVDGENAAAPRVTGAFFRAGSRRRRSEAMAGEAIRRSPRMDERRGRANPRVPASGASRILTARRRSSVCRFLLSVTAYANDLPGTFVCLCRLFPMQGKDAASFPVYIFFLLFQADTRYSAPPRETISGLRHIARKRMPYTAIPFSCGKSDWGRPTCNRSAK